MARLRQCDEIGSLKRLVRKVRRLETRTRIATARHYIEVSSAKREKGVFVVENVLVIRVGRRFDSRTSAWEFAYDTTGWTERKISNASR
jgi:hypothetical protein